MKRKIFLFLIAPYWVYPEPRQFFENVDENNPRLLALQKWLEAEKYMPKTGFIPIIRKLVTIIFWQF
jgi:hypothetical protein